jgi:AraC family transcriptional regulator of adaptative response/methylated-DNA-[protein]-cysteine methyltransferase
MYRAMVERDRSFDGSFFGAVRTTGVFCRPGCGARPPRRENVEFFATPGEALRAGYRPCKRCKPLEVAGELPAWVSELFARVESTPERIDSRALRRSGVEPARAARWFKEHFGMTFQGYQRVRRVSAALRPLSAGAAVTEAALATGYQSESGFREAFERLFGAPPSAAAGRVAAVRVQWLPTPIGPLLAAARDEGLCLLEFLDRRALRAQVAALRKHVEGAIVPGEHPLLARARRELERYFSGASERFDVPIHAPGTPFQQRVWAALREIPFGETRSYTQLARAIGAPNAVRAVARANGQNRIALVIPCHRVIGADGQLVGYAGGLWRKRWLVDHEARIRDE